jgi:hypothetical protein
MCKLQPPGYEADFNSEIRTVCVWCGLIILMAHGSCCRCGRAAIRVLHCTAHLKIGTHEFYRNGTEII